MEGLVRLLDENLWVLHRRAKDSSRDEVCYVLAPNAEELWTKVVEDELLGTGHTRRALKASGWKAIQIGVLLLV